VAIELLIWNPGMCLLYVHPGSLCHQPDRCPIMQVNIRPENNVILLLTACIDPRNVIAVGRRDIATRLEDYKLTLGSG